MNNETATLENAFQIIEGELPSIATNINQPGSTRPNRTITIQIQYTNDGNVDLRNAEILLISLAGAPIAFTRENLKKGETQLILNLVELNGPEGILRPGASGTITVYAHAIAPLGFIMIIPDFQ